MQIWGCELYGEIGQPERTDQRCAQYYGHLGDLYGPLQTLSAAKESEGFQFPSAQSAS